MIRAQAAANPRAPVVVSVPHAGLLLPPERGDLASLPRETFLRDVDYEIHRAWEPACGELGLSFIRCEAHRYALDLNRREDQFSRLSVEGGPEPGSDAKKALFWLETTHGEPLLQAPLPRATAKALIETIWRPYMSWIDQELDRLCAEFGFAILIDGHSMPSRGTSFHADPGAPRADIVPGDNRGRSCDPTLLRACLDAAARAGLSCRPNDPYSGGGITQRFGEPARGRHALQIEANRALYMDETSWELKDEGLKRLSDFACDFLESACLIRGA